MYDIKQCGLKQYWLIGKVCSSLCVLFEDGMIALELIVHTVFTSTLGGV